MNERFVVFSIILFFVILISEYLAYASLHSVGIIKSTKLEIFLMSLAVIFPLAFILSMIYSYKHYSAINSFINTVSSIWLGLVCYLFIASLIIIILIVINHFWGLQIPIKLISTGLLLVVFSLISYGLLNAGNPRIVRWDITNESLSAWKGKKIILVSDIHIGNLNDRIFLERIVKDIKSENPDITFNLGDLIDGSVFPYKDWLSPLSKINSPLGDYYVEGNHEKYNQQYEVFKSQFPIGITDLTNKKIILNNTQIIGLDYIQNESDDEIKNRLSSLGYDPNIPSLVLLHDPKNVNALSESNVTLTMSGHTHGGQFFPFNLLVKRIYKELTYGISRKQNTVSLVTNGVGTSVIPIRIGTKPEIVILNIN